MGSSWIDGPQGMLQRTLIRKKRIPLGLSEYLKEPRLPGPLVRRSDQEQPLPPGKRMIDVFDENVCSAGKMLLILGQPGAGKTTSLLELTRELLKCAWKDKTHPIPVVFPLSTWAETRLPLTKWMVAELIRRRKRGGIYYMDHKYAQAWVKRNKILPLLDGLDEVKPEHRAACARAINDFHEVHGQLPLVVSSRTAEYQDLTGKHPVGVATEGNDLEFRVADALELDVAIVVQPLTHKQVDDYLDELGPDGESVRRALAEDPSLWELLDTPLMLWVVAKTYAGDSDARPCPGGSREERRDRLFEAYVKRVLRHRYKDTHAVRDQVDRPDAPHRRQAAKERTRSKDTRGSPYPPERALRWLSWLARQMKMRNLTVFYPELLQLDWVPWGQRRAFGWVYTVAVLVGGLVGGLVWGLVWGLVIGLVGRMAGGPVAGLGVGPVGGLGGGLGGGRGDGLVGALVAWIFLLPLFLFAEIEVKFLSYRDLNLLMLPIVLALRLVWGLVWGLVVGLVVGLVGRLVGGLVGAARCAGRRAQCRAGRRAGRRSGRRARPRAGLRADTQPIRWSYTYYSPRLFCRGQKS